MAEPLTHAAWPASRARPAGAVRDATTLIGRALRLSRRNTEALITSLLLPVMLMLMFVYLFGGAIRVDTSYATYVVPGVILVCAAFGSSTTAVVVSEDMKAGIVDRFRSLDIGGAVMVTGHVVASVARNLVATALVFGLGLAVGFRPHASVPQWLAVFGVLVLFMTAMSWLAGMVGMIASTPEAASGSTFVVMFLPYASSAFVPIATMPTWLHGFARNQPCTPIIETIRGTLAGHPDGGSATRAIAWCLALLAVGVAGSAVAFRRRTA